MSRRLRQLGELLACAWGGGDLGGVLCERAGLPNERRTSHCVEHLPLRGECTAVDSGERR
eukprot:scaffold169694_cov37-Tisochrysis_lutea.AAC.2